MCLAPSVAVSLVLLIFFFLLSSFGIFSPCFLGPFFVISRFLSLSSPTPHFYSFHSLSLFFFFWSFPSPTLSLSPNLLASLLAFIFNYNPYSHLATSPLFFHLHLLHFLSSPPIFPLFFSFPRFRSPHPFSMILPVFLFISPCPPQTYLVISYAQNCLRFVK